MRLEFGAIDTRIYSNVAPRAISVQQELNGFNNGVVSADKVVISEVQISKPVVEQSSPTTELIDDELIDDEESLEVDFDEAFGD
ncbi:MAG: hypothetical protein QNJ54_33930 [Prochloraceae cyanobacterium]|nr:hypothetical protein [Prochloraceae cyanobacterium]